MDSKKLLLLLQFSDSAFPTGGFAHSLGLEAFIQYFGKHDLRKNIQKVQYACIGILENTGSLHLPFVRSSYLLLTNGINMTVHDCKNEVKERCNKLKSYSHIHETNLCSHRLSKNFGILDGLKQLDKLCEASSTNHIARRASTRQGKALFDLSQVLYGDGVSNELMSHIQELPHCHYPVIHGAVMAAIGMDLETVLATFMYSAARNMIGTLVKQDMVDALEGQRLQLNLQQIIPDIISRNKLRNNEDCGVKCPAVDIIQNVQDTFYMKVFYS